MMVCRQREPRCPIHVSHGWGPIPAYNRRLLPFAARRMGYLQYTGIARVVMR